MPKIIPDPVPSPDGGSGICLLAPRANEQVIYIYKCVKVASIIDFIGTNLSGMKEIMLGPRPEPVSGSGICHPAPRAKDQAIFIYKCVKRPFLSISLVQNDPA